MSLRPVIDTAPAHIRLPEAEEGAVLLAIRQDNRWHLAHREPQRDESDDTLACCEQSIAEGNRAASLYRGYPLAVFSRYSPEIIATFTLPNIVQGLFQACLLG